MKKPLLPKFKKGMETREARRANFDQIMSDRKCVGTPAEFDALFEKFEELYQVLGVEQ